jgi:multiple sugar transport system permease protein
MRGLAPMLLPAGAAALVLVALPAIAAVAISFTNYDALTAPKGVGLANFRAMWRDDVFRTALGNSALFIAVVVPLRLVVAVGVGLLVSAPRRGAGLARTATTLPSFAPEIAVAVVWLWIFNPLYGPLAGALSLLGLPSAEWLTSWWGARAAVAVMSIFLVGEAIIVVAAARNEIPQALYEAAAIEGGSRRHVFRHLTLPLLAPVLVVLAARDVAVSLQATFIPALVLTGGGPEYATTFLPLWAYRNAFEFLHFGYAAAMTVVMLAIAGLAAAAAALVLRRVVAT